MNVEDIELGNLMFNPNTVQEQKCPEYFVALLKEINHILSRAMWNIYQENYDSPFENSGNSFESPVFSVEAYNWDDNKSQDYNFIYYMDKSKNVPDIKVSWYKYLGRDTTINRDWDYSTLIEAFNKCIEYLRQYEIDGLKNRGFEF